MWRGGCFFDKIGVISHQTNLFVNCHVAKMADLTNYYYIAVME